MLTIRPEQMEVFAKELLRSTKQRFVGCVAEIAGGPDQAAEQVYATADRYGLDRPEDWLRLAALCRRHGYDWPSSPETRWIHEYLSDSRVSSPSDRLLRVERENERRKEVAEFQAKVVARFRKAARP